MGAFIRLAAIITSVIVLLGFAFFAVDELDKGSKTQQQAVVNEIESGGNPADVAPIAPTPTEENSREAQNSSIRELVDDANDVLLAPFSSLVDSENSWVNHGIPALLALLLYGVGLGMLANVLPKERHHNADWRASES